VPGGPKQMKNPFTPDKKVKGEWIARSHATPGGPPIMELYQHQLDLVVIPKLRRFGIPLLLRLFSQKH
jgi:hypothetical protein